jgi:hypothetical protein
MTTSYKPGDYIYYYKKYSNTWDTIPAIVIKVTKKCLYITSSAEEMPIRVLKSSCELQSYNP